MQDAREPRTNQARSEATQLALLSAARALFVRKGYAETSTPEIVAAAGITRGALYHHYADKRDLFRAVLEREARAVAGDIERATPANLPPRDAMIAGTVAYLDAMTVAGRTRLLLIEGAAVLGPAAMEALDAANAGRTLRQGLEAVLSKAGRRKLSVPALAVLLSATFDRAALAIEAGGDADDYRSTMIEIVQRLIGGAGGS